MFKHQREAAAAPKLWRVEVEFYRETGLKPVVIYQGHEWADANEAAQAAAKHLPNVRHACLQWLWGKSEDERYARWMTQVAIASARAWAEPGQYMTGY